jgi:hypothetical protein
MNINGRSRRLVLLLLVALLVAGFAAAFGAARSTVLKPLKCPNPKTAPLGMSLGTRGYLACDDDATATAAIAGRLTKYPFKNGVCWKDSTLRLNVDIGTVVNPGSRKKSDLPGFSLVIGAKGAFALPSAHVGVTKNGKIIEGDGAVNVRVKWGPKPSGTFSPHKLSTSDGKISGSFQCKRLLKVPG